MLPARRTTARLAPRTVPAVPRLPEPPPAPAAHTALDAELLDRLATHGRPASPRQLYGGMAPAWVLLSFARLLEQGRVEVLPETADREPGDVAFAVAAPNPYHRSPR